MCSRTQRSPEDVVAGLPVGAADGALCAGCYDPLRAGARCTAYTYALAGGSWDVPRIYCLDCAPDGLTPTLGASELLADCTLATRSEAATQSHHLVLSRPTITTRSAPAVGAPP